MDKIVYEIDAISELALEIMLSILEQKKEAQEIMQDESGPLALAEALSDYFQIAAGVESGAASLNSDELSEFGAYGIDLLDRLSFLVRQLEIMDRRDHVSRVFTSLAVWLARREAVIDNLDGAADGFGMLVNGLSEPGELAEMCRLMEEVIESVSERIQLDEDRSNPWRPWRVINLNTGIAATRSLEPGLMEDTFEKLGRRLPHDMPGFFADGRRQMMTQNVPEAVTEVMNRYADKWPDKPPH
jgi:hypothetical protein